KSSLLNALAQREAAIVTDEPGTTRDILEVALDINGLKIVVADTAGIRAGAGKGASIGVEKAKARGRDADLAQGLGDLADPHPIDMSWTSGSAVTVGTKLDLIPAPQRSGRIYDHLISTRTAEGMNRLIQRIGEIAEQRVDLAGDILPSRLRHVELLQDALVHI